MFVKDSSGMVQNLDNTQLKYFLNARERAKREKSLCKTIDSLQSEMKDIRKCLDQILNKEV